MRPVALVVAASLLACSGGAGKAAPEVTPGTKGDKGDGGSAGSQGPKGDAGSQGPQLPPPLVGCCSPREPEYDRGDEPEYDWGDEEGVVGGVSGGGSEDAPTYATAGFRKPALVKPRCVQESTRIPGDLLGFVSGPITVQFAVRRDARPSQFRVITNGVPDRISAAIWQAVQECQWTPGADPQGRPASIWMILPLRFTGG